jgi:hypothetical protein
VEAVGCAVVEGRQPSSKLEPASTVAESAIMFCRKRRRLMGCPSGLLFERLRIRVNFDIFISLHLAIPPTDAGVFTIYPSRLYLTYPKIYSFMPHHVPAPSPGNRPRREGRCLSAPNSRVIAWTLSRSASKVSSQSSAQTWLVSHSNSNSVIGPVAHMLLYASISRGCLDITFLLHYWKDWAGKARLGSVAWKFHPVITN